MVSAAEVSAEEGAVIGVAYDGESFPAMLSFYTEAGGDECVISSHLTPCSFKLSCLLLLSHALPPTDTPRSALTDPRRRSQACAATSARWSLSPVGLK